jgi:hypothetical protein
MCSCLERMRGRAPAAICVRSAVLCAGALAVTFGAAGCAQKQQYAATPPPMVVDEAMQRRDWEPSVAYIPNGDTVAGVNRFPLRSAGYYGEGGTPDYVGAAGDVGLSIAQTFALPFTYILVPPFEPQVYRAEAIGPTYHGMPQMSAGRGRKPVRVDGVRVNPERLEVLPPPAGEQRSPHGPMGPGDTEFMSSPPSPAGE